MTDANPNDPAKAREADDRAPLPAGQGDAGADQSIVERLEDDPESSDARLDTALDESMDASDPPSATQPAHRPD